MHKKALVYTTLFTGLVGLSMPAFALNDGNLDDTWFKAQIKTIIPTAVDATGNGPWKLLKNVPVDTGKDNCYVQLNWQGKDTYEYQLAAFCLNDQDKWERGHYNGSVFELNDSKKSIGSDWTFFYLAPKNRSFGTPPNDSYIGFEGTLVFYPKFNRNGDVINFTVSTQTGTIYAWDNDVQIGGMARSSGLTLKFVNIDDVPQGAKDCAAGGDEPLCP